MTEDGIDILLAFILVMIRFGGLVSVAPILGSANFPNMAKAGLVMFGALVITGTLLPLEGPFPRDTFGLLHLALGELLIGVLLGFILTLVFAAIQVGGQIIDLQTGFGMMNVFNPAMESQVPIFGFFLFIIAVLYLLLLNGHHEMVRALASTYDTIPFGGFTANPDLLFEISRWGRRMFLDGLMIAAPIATAMLMAYATMGILARLVPQIHLFVVGFPFTIGLGLFVMAFAIGVYLTVLDGMFWRMFKDLETIIRGMS